MVGWTESEAGGGGWGPAGNGAQIGAQPCHARRPHVPACHPLRPSWCGCLLPAWQPGAAPVHDAAYSQFLLPVAPVHCTPCTARFNTTPSPFSLLLSPCPHAMFLILLQLPAPPLVFHASLGSTTTSRCALRAAPRTAYLSQRAQRALRTLTFRTALCFRLNFITSPPSLRQYPTHARLTRLGS